MPRGDGTGPAGTGPQTGRGLGPCTGYSTPGGTNPGSGRLATIGTLGRWAAGVLPILGLGLGLGRRQGRGRGRNRR